MSLTKINILDPIVFEITRENTLPLVVSPSADYSVKSVKFAVKADENNTTAEVIVKRNTIGGGSDSQMIVTANSITVYLLYTDTANLTSQKKWYWEVKDITDQYRIAWGYLILQPTVISIYDPPYVPVPPTGSQKIFSIVSNAVVPEIDVNYNATITLTKLATGTYQLDSDVAIFTDADMVDISLVLRADTDFYFFMLKKNSSTQLIVTITSLFAGGTQDHDFRISMFRVS